MLPDQLYSFLTLSEEPANCDCIFVFAGIQERKDFGLSLYKAGYSPVLLFSVGRFEWRKFLTFGFKNNSEFRELVDRIPYYLRHFFVELNNQKNDSCWAVQKGRYGTLAEVIALVEFIKKREFKSIMLISSAFHLRRINYVMRKLLNGYGIEINYVAVPEELSAINRENWWKTPRGIKLIFSEYIKLIAYRVLVPRYLTKIQRKQKSSTFI